MKPGKVVARWQECGTNYKLVLQEVGFTVCEGDLRSSTLSKMEGVELIQDLLTNDTATICSDMLRLYHKCFGDDSIQLSNKKAFIKALIVDCGHRVEPILTPDEEEQRIFFNKQAHFTEI